WTTDLRTGAALGGVDVKGLGGSYHLVTDDAGLGRGALNGSPTSALVATLGNDTAILPHNDWSEDGGMSSSLYDDARWYVLHDRAVYRPGETVSMKGWVRRFTASSDGQLELVGKGAAVGYVVTDPQGNQIAGGTVDVNALGGFDFRFDLRADANL